MTQLYELAGEDAVNSAMQQPRWSAAALGTVTSGSLLPLAKFVTTYVESQQR